MARFLDVLTIVNGRNQKKLRIQMENIPFMEVVE